MSEHEFRSDGYMQNFKVRDSGAVESYEPIMDAVVIQWIDNEDGLSPVVSVMLKNDHNRELYEAKARMILDLLTRA